MPLPRPWAWSTTMSPPVFAMASARGWEKIDPNPALARNRGMKPALVWFRQDLRLSDNPALAFAAQSGRPLICFYILDDETPSPWAPGGAARWWLHHALEHLDKALSRKGGHLVLRRGRADKILDDVLK